MTLIVPQRDLYLPWFVLLLFIYMLACSSASTGSIKKGNRKSEILLREVEVGRLNPVAVFKLTSFQYVATLASLYSPKDYVYPYDRINECWEKVCLNQCEYLALPFSITLCRI
jgi:hypothetical protein